MNRGNRGARRPYRRIRQPQAPYPPYKDFVPGSILRGNQEPGHGQMHGPPRVEQQLVFKPAEPQLFPEEPQLKPEIIPVPDLQQQGLKIAEFLEHYEQKEETVPDAPVIASNLDEVKPVSAMETSPDEASSEYESPKKNPVSKKERINRIMNRVKPKSSMAILNEMSCSHTYNVTTDGKAFQATLTLNNAQFVGSGGSKSVAQTVAAEAALKHIVLSNDLHLLRAGEIPALTYSQLLSFALYKLLLSWDKNATYVSRMQSSPSSCFPAEVKPTKKFPTNPELLHPVMLLSQTHPQAKFVEIASTPPPNSSFTMACLIDFKKFAGTGKNKKEAKRRAAMLACQQLFDVKYPNTEELVALPAIQTN